MISDRFRTVDYMMSLNKSVNLIINKKNAADMDKILSKGISDYDMFYRIYKETMNNERCRLSSNTRYTCYEYREEMLLLGLQRRLHAEGVSEEEREHLKERIKELESSMDMA